MKIILRFYVTRPATSDFAPELQSNFPSHGEKGTRQMTIWRIRIACRLPKAPNTHGLCNTHCFSTAKMVTHASV